MANAARAQPLLLVLEDLHDADRGTLDLLLHLARTLHGARLPLNNHNAASIHSKYGFRQKDGYGCLGIFCQDLCAAQNLIDFMRPT